MLTSFWLLKLTNVSPSQTDYSHTTSMVEGTGAEMRPAVVSGIVTGDALVSLLGSFRKGVFGRRASTGSDVFSL